MPTDVQGNAFWHSIDSTEVSGGCVSAQYTLRQGIEPGVASYTVSLGQASEIKSVDGNLFIEESNDNRVMLQNCRIVNYDTAFSGQGRTIQFNIMDERWKWRLGAVSGVFNERDEKGKITVASRRQLNDMAALCIECIPTELEWKNKGSLEEPKEADLPAVNWDFANPAAALRDLLEPFGYVICYRPLTKVDGVESGPGIWIGKRGIGQTLPEARGFTAAAPAISVPQLAGELRFVGGETNFMAVVPLEAVGIEMDGTVKVIADLSYIPTGTQGWTRTGPPGFNDVAAPAADKPDILAPGLTRKPNRNDEFKDLARSCVYRYYRVYGMNGAVPVPLKVEGYGEVAEPTKQIVLQPAIYTNDLDSEGNTVVFRARVHGERDTGKQTETTSSNWDDVQQNGFTIDAARGLIIFDKPTFRIATDPNDANKFIWMPADLKLICSVQIRDAKTRQIVRFQHPAAKDPLDLGKDQVAKDGEPIEWVRRDQVQLNHTVEYSIDADGNFTLQFARSNQADCEKAAEFFLNARRKEQEIVAGGTMTVPGVYTGLDIDGAITEITWTVGGGQPCTTTLSRNSEHAHWLPSLEQVKRGSQIREVLKDRSVRPPRRDIVGPREVKNS